MARQRKFSRLSFTSASTLAVGQQGQALRTELVDISLKGALVELPQGFACELGTPAVLTVHLDEQGERIEMKATIAHVTQTHLGLHCVSIDVESMIHLRRLMELNLGDPTLLERELLNLG